MNARRASAKKSLRPWTAGIALALIGGLGAFGLAGGEQGVGRPAAGPAWKPVTLRCEDTVNPLGLDAAAVRLSWTLEPPLRGLRQTAYRILVASSEELLEPGRADLWDSERTESSKSLLVPYAGPPLRSRARYHWKVQLWDGRGEASPWSAPAWWEMGLLRNEDWTGHWIGLSDAGPVTDPDVKDWIEGTAAPAPRLETRPEILQRLSDLQPAVHLRKGFWLTGDIRRARAYICGLGWYELYLNGLKVGDRVLDPAPTDYDKRALYAVYDVTAALKKGDNAAGVILGDGFYGQSVSEFASKMEYGLPGLLFQLEVEYTDGSSFRLATDRTWKAAAGPVLKSNVFAGEVYDARREIAGWSEAAFEDGSWRPADAVEPLAPRLEAQIMTPIRAVETLRPVRLSRPKPGVWVFDFGRNFAGWARLRVRAGRGTALRLRFAEFMEPDGLLNYDSTGPYATGVVQSDLYICRGDGRETWEPRFTYHGFRYAELTGYPGEPSLDTLEGIVVRTAAPRSGSFWCSDDLLNRIHETALRTFEANLHGIPTDCPARERAGWLGDAHVTIEATLYNFDLAAFWRKFVRDIETTSDLNGGVPAAVAPGRRRVGRPPDWGVATVLLPWYLYTYGGDIRVLADHYDYMVEFCDYFRSLASGGIVQAGLGDWWDPTPSSGAERTGGGGKPQNTKPALTSTAYYFFSSKIMSTVAGLLGREEDAGKYRVWADEIKSAFNAAFSDSSRSDYGSQTADALALYMGLVPDGQEERVARSLALDVTDKWKGHFSTGSHGATRLYGALGRYGFDETAYAIFHQNGYPGFPYLFSLGATTLWERMGSLKPGQTAPEGSLNHPFHGGFDLWFYQGVAGIEPDPERPGFKHTLMKPGLFRQMERAEASFRSPYGEIRSAWRSDGGVFVWDVTIPANTTATVSIPTVDAEKIQEGSGPVSASPGVRFLRLEAGFAIYEIEAGVYVFRSPIGSPDGRKAPRRTAPPLGRALEMVPAQGKTRNSGDTIPIQENWVASPNSGIRPILGIPPQVDSASVFNEE